MEQVTNLLLWFAGGVIFLFVFLVALNRAMQNESRRNREYQGHPDGWSNKAIQTDAASRRS